MTIKLPEGIIKSKDDITDYSFLLLGEKKVGKTSLIAEFEDHLIIECEPGNARHIDCRYVDITSWDQAVEVLELLHNKPAYAKCIGIDEVDMLHWYCEQHARKIVGLKDNQKSNFDVWNIVKRIFYNYIGAIQKLPATKFYTGHTEIKEVEMRGGAKVAELSGSMTSGCKKLMDKYLTFCGYIMKDSQEVRTMQIEGDRWIKAFNGLSEKHFRSVGGQPLTKINLGKSPKEAYVNFMKAFNNEVVLKGEQAKSKPKIKLGIKNAS